MLRSPLFKLGLIVQGVFWAILIILIYIAVRTGPDVAIFRYVGF